MRSGVSACATTPLRARGRAACLLARSATAPLFALTAATWRFAYFTHALHFASSSYAPRATAVYNFLRSRLTCCAAAALNGDPRISRSAFCRALPARALNLLLPCVSMPLRLPCNQPASWYKTASRLPCAGSCGAHSYVLYSVLLDEDAFSRRIASPSFINAAAQTPATALSHCDSAASLRVNFARSFIWSWFISLRRIGVRLLTQMVSRRAGVAT